jgi:hypothetical protein
MANSFTTQILEEGPRNVAIKLVGVLDTSNLSSTAALAMSSINQGGYGPTPTAVKIEHIEYQIGSPLAVQLLWNATADVVAVALVGSGFSNLKKLGGLTNNAGSGKTGTINILTTGYSSGTAVFTIILRLTKQGTNL